MPDVTLNEVAASQPITSIASDICATIVDTERGRPNVPFLVGDFDQHINQCGYYKSGSYSGYDVEGFFANKGKGLWEIRVVGEDARNAGGAEDYKVDIFKPQLIKGAANGILNVQSDVEGLDGALTNLTITANTTDVTTATLANTYDIALKIASTSAWKKSAKVCATVLNGQAHLVTAGSAAADADNSVVFYADDAGTAGNSLSVEVIDSGGGGLTAAYDASGTALTIDLGAANPAASAVIIAVNALAGAVLSYITGTGAGTWNAIVAQTNLASGIASIPALVTASSGGTGLTAIAIATKTWLAGVGSVTALSDGFTDTTGLDKLTAVTSKVIPGDKLIIYNGANKGSYTIDGVTGEETITVSEAFATTQTNVIYSIMGTDGAYGHVTSDLLSPGTRGDSFSLAIEKEFGDATLKATLSVTDGDDAVRVLETHENLSPVSTDPNFIETIIAANSDWMSVDVQAENIKATGTGTTTAGDNTLTDALATFEDDEVEVGDLVIAESATTAGDVRVYEITVVTDNTHIDLDANFTGSQADVVYSVVGVDTAGLALMSLVGSDGITVTFAGGVSDTPLKADYLGSSALKTGVYAIDKIPVSSRPTKLFVPDAPIVVDSSGVDATNLVNVAMGEYCTSRQFLRYTFMAERGLTPTQAIAAAAVDGINSKFVAEYYNWGRVNDPVTGVLKLVPLTGHMTGQAVGVSAGQFSKEGDHDACANVLIAGVVILENEVSQPEAEALNNNNINCIRNWYGIRNMGDRVRTTDAAWKWLHKRDFAIRINQSILLGLKAWVSFSVNALSTYGKITKTVSAFLRDSDRRNNPTAGLLNIADPSAQPYYVDCKWDTPGNDLAKTKIFVKMGYSIVNTVEDVEIRVALWDGGDSLSES